MNPVTDLSTPILKGANSTSCSGIGQNHLYALSTHQDSKASPNIVTGMLKLFSHDVYYLLDLGSTLSRDLLYGYLFWH